MQMIRTGGVFLFTVMTTVPTFAQPSRQPATTADFQALAAQVSALQARVAKLEAGAVVPADLVGTYRLFSFGAEMHGNPARIGNEVGDATITFRADGTATVNWTDYRADLREGSPWFITHDVTPFAGEIVWALTPDGLTGLGTTATVSAGGRILFWGGQSQTVNGSWSQLAIAVKLP